ncbi:SMP-30/gluconolactonase/LRE family protein [Streptomyces canus]|uniref:SMP-30/gluconolactonase/LRE family protein n=1 Tax=Streptomyces canus TaxID=58343 RepID=UPI0027D9211F|nr:SMP-30/gluconolactonase/LRE family protein [Streptomyces canus]
MAAAGTGIALLTPDGALDWLDRPEDRTSFPSRMNDGVADPAGRFWAGSMAYDGTPGAGSLYRTDPDGTVVRVLDGLTIANGPAFTADGTTMYLADTAAGTILRCRIDPLSGDLLGSPETHVGVPAPRRQPPVRHHSPVRGEEPDRDLRRGARLPGTGRGKRRCGGREADGDARALPGPTVDELG